MGSTLEIASLRRTSRPQAANAPQCRPGTTRWRNIAARLMLVSIAGSFAALPASAADDEIRIGNTMPYTGPASAYGVIGKTLSAYFDKVNAEGGVNGRRIKFISYDDAYSPLTSPSCSTRRCTSSRRNRSSA